MPAVAPFRVEIDLVDCEVVGRIPDDLNGSFYRVGPDLGAIPS
jgi:carotenoid cleavage dioxygenase-like enzyme